MLCNCKPVFQGKAQSRIVWRQGDKGEEVCLRVRLFNVSTYPPNGDNTMLRFRSAPQLALQRAQILDPRAYSLL